MESKITLKDEKKFNVKPLKIMYIIIFAFILMTDILVIVSLLTGWIQLRVVEMHSIRFLWMNLMFVISPVLKVGFEVVEIVRFGRFLKSDRKNIEGAINVGRGFRGTRIFRVYYLLLELLQIGSYL